MDAVLKDVVEGGLDGRGWLGALERVFPRLGALCETPQEPEWHGDGDVATHTAMVVDEAIADGADLCQLLAALLHDIGKAMTTREREIEGRRRIVAPGHPRIGASYVAPRLEALGIGREAADRVRACVRWHHEPLRLVRRGAGRARFEGLALRAPLSALYHLGRADLRGRICASREAQLEQLELFRLMAEEYGLWEGPHPWEAWIGGAWEALGEGAPVEDVERLVVEGWRDREAGVITTLYEAIARSYGWRERERARLVVTVGPSGAGKSTWVAQELEGYEVISLDGLRAAITGSRSDQRRNDEVLRVARQRLKAALRARRDVVWEATSLRRDFRDAVMAEGMRYGAHRTLVVFLMTPEVYHARNAAREVSVSPSVLEQQLRRWQLPEAGEAHRVLVIDETGAVSSDSRARFRRG